MVQSEYLQVRKHRKTACQFAKDVPNKVVSYLAVDDSGRLIPSVNECPVFFVLANQWQTVMSPKPNLPEDFDACDHNAPQLRVRV